MKPSTHDFQFIGGSIALDFVNTVGNRLGASRDYFTSPSECRRWARLAGLLGKGEELSLTAAEWKNLLQTREDLYDLFRKPVKQAALETLNARLAQVAPYRQLLIQESLVRWVWKTPPGDPVRLLGPLLFDAAELLTAGSYQKVHECSGGACGWLFLDRSQAGKRRWCSMGDCGNRDKVRHYYQRKQVTRPPNS